MNKTIEELVYSFAIRQFHKAPINTERDLMCVCSDFANEFLAQPLSSRLTEAEKERVRKVYCDAERGEVNGHYDVYPEPCEVMRVIFGSDFFKEGE